MLQLATHDSRYLCWNDLQSSPTFWVKTSRSFFYFVEPIHSLFSSISSYDLQTCHSSFKFKLYLNHFLKGIWYFHVHPNRFVTNSILNLVLLFYFFVFHIISLWLRKFLQTIKILFWISFSVQFSRDTGSITKNFLFFYMILYFPVFQNSSVYLQNFLQAISSLYLFLGTVFKGHN